MNSSCDIQNIEGTVQPNDTSVLLVEDDDAVREMLALMLRTEGYEVIESGDGMEALNYLAAVGVFNDELSYPDIIISDIQMPMFTGLDLLVGIGECFPLPPLILFTGYDDADLFAEAYRLGAKRILKKPFAPQTLCQAIRDVLNGNLEGAGVSPVSGRIDYRQSLYRHVFE